MTEAKRSHKKKAATGALVPLCPTCIYERETCGAIMTTVDGDLVVKCQTFKGATIDHVPPAVLATQSVQEAPPTPTPGTITVEVPLGDCPACGKPLTRRKYIREFDVVCCLNRQCKFYRRIVRRIILPAGMPKPIKKGKAK